jgi:hypothetical protein
MVGGVVTFSTDERVLQKVKTWQYILLSPKRTKHPVQYSMLLREGQPAMLHSCIDVNRLWKDIEQAVCKTKKKHAACIAMDHTKYKYAFIANYFL